ncbi:ATP-binding protein [Fodinicola feengrottensis]|uniref:ATP-binding protein n=1 Tax=Fodinicola feengrottensis TaxID=435914 RepID=UPI0013D899F8|nr:tetratricopeptide repeat protein [Fodinicola feengrottensis]
MITAIAGTAGVGKTALAVQWAHRIRDRFPDGQLYANLNGYGVGPPLRSQQVLSQFLRALGVPPSQVPVDVAEATAVYRTLMADRAMVVLLDNACTADQIRPLLPASAGCLVVVTSRDRLDGLVARDGARRLTLDVLSVPESVALLERMLGGRAADEPLAITQLAATCAYLPLALRIAAAHLTNHHDWRVGDYLADLRDGNVIAALEVEGDQQSAVRAAFDLSYGSLAPDEQRVFRLLGLMPGTDMTSRSMAALADCEAPDARRLLERLATAHLIHQHVPGRYTFHDLLRRYANEKVHRDVERRDREAALNRLFDHYLHTARAASDLLYSQIIRLPLDKPGAAARPVVFAGYSDARGWLDAEHTNLVSAVQHAQEHGPSRAAWQLADAMRGHLQKCQQVVDWLIVAHAAISAAHSDGEVLGYGAAQFNLATAHACLSHYSLAVQHYAEALELYQRAGWKLGEAAVHTNLGWIDEDLGRLHQAAVHQSRALDLAHEGGWTYLESTALVNLALLRFFDGRLEEAAEHNRRALILSRQAKASGNEGYALDGLGVVAFLQGRLDEAAELCGEAVDIFCRIGHSADQALARTYLAAILGASGQAVDALECANIALSLVTDSRSDRRVEAAARTAVGVAAGLLGHRRGRLTSASEPSGWPGTLVC